MLRFGTFEFSCPCTARITDPALRLLTAEYQSGDHGVERCKISAELLRLGSEPQKVRRCPRTDTPVQQWTHWDVGILCVLLRAGQSGSCRPLLACQPQYDPRNGTTTANCTAGFLYTA